MEGRGKVVEGGQKEELVVEQKDGRRFVSEDQG